VLVELRLVRQRRRVHSGITGQHRRPVERDDNILTLETGKVALDIPPYAGRVIEIHVTEGDTVDEGAPLITLETT
jgi:biotin carboxyl carrier protein